MLCVLLMVVVAGISYLVGYLRGSAKEIEKETKDIETLVNQIEKTIRERRK